MSSQELTITPRDRRTTDRMSKNEIIEKTVAKDSTNGEKSENLTQSESKKI